MFSIVLHSQLHMQMCIITVVVRVTSILILLDKYLTYNIVVLVSKSSATFSNILPQFQMRAYHELELIVTVLCS